MPYVVTGNNSSGYSFNNAPADGYDYEYPTGLDLRPNTKLHTKLKDMVLQCAREAYGVNSRRFDSWQQIDQVMTAYISTDSEEQALKNADPRKPVSIIFPYTYAVSEIILTHLISVLLQDPIFSYEGVSPEDTVGAILLEKTIRMHCYRAKVGLALHTFLRDCISKGIGIVSPQWEVRTGKRMMKFNRREGLIDGSVREVPYKHEVEATLYEGNSLENIDPYRAFIDPNVSVHKVQKGQYVGWLNQTSYMDILRREGTSKGWRFNAKYLQHCKNRISQFGVDNSAREKKFGGSLSTAALTQTTRIDEIYMYVDIIPKEYGLSPRETPEKWLFCLANDEIILQAQPLSINHEMYPIAVGAPEFDGYSTTPMGRLEILYGLQTVLDHLFNSHIANVRKAVNDMLVVDPYLINVDDLKTPGPGKIIRTRRPSWGRGVKDCVQQLAVTDITQNNIADSQYIIQWMQRAAAADDSMGGFLRQGGPERLTTAEYQGTRSGAQSRMGRISRVIGMQAMQDIGYMFAAHAQQFMSEEVYVSSAGRWPEVLQKHFGARPDSMKVSPFDLLVDYDITVRDGSLPEGDTAAWVEVFKTVSSNQALMQTFDITRIFTHIASLMGAKNIDDFIIEQPGQLAPQMMQDEAIQQQQQAGNIIPIGESSYA